MISFIVPARNEQACLGRTLQAIHESARIVALPYEIIVVDDASTDATGEIARQNNARLVGANHRQIAATRNSGARAAKGERLFFVDADTTINPRAVASAIRAMDNGAVGGGAPVRFDGAAPLYAHVLVWWLSWPMRLVGISGGAMLFCTRDAFHAVGGLDEKLFGAEDAAFSWALKREGRFVVLWRWIVTSGRRMRGLNGVRILATLVRMAFFPKMLASRTRVKEVWYDSNRGSENQTRDSLAIRLLNSILLVIALVWISGPLWNLIPLDSQWFGVRRGVGVFSCHVALVLWPCAWFLFRNLLRQRRWFERIKLAALIAVCLWMGWSATRIVIWFWPWAWSWLTGA